MSYTVIPKGRENGRCFIKREQLFYAPTGEAVSKLALQEHLVAAKRRKVWVNTWFVLDQEGRDRTFSIRDGRMRLGCCRFSKANTRKILRWLENGDA